MPINSEQTTLSAVSFPVARHRVNVFFRRRFVPYLLAIDTNYGFHFRFTITTMLSVSFHSARSLHIFAVRLSSIYTHVMSPILLIKRPADIIRLFPKNCTHSVYGKWSRHSYRDRRPARTRNHRRQILLQTCRRQIIRQLTTTGIYNRKYNAFGFVFRNGF